MVVVLPCSCLNSWAVVAAVREPQPGKPRAAAGQHRANPAVGRCLARHNSPSVPPTPSTLTRALCLPGVSLSALFREFLLTDDLDEVADRLETHNANVRDALSDSVFADVDVRLDIAKTALDAVTLELNIETLDELVAALGNFSAVPAVTAVSEFQDLLRLHTQDKFDVVLQEILNIWTVRAVCVLRCRALARRLVVGLGWVYHAFV